MVITKHGDQWWSFILWWTTAVRTSPQQIENGTFNTENQNRNTKKKKAQNKQE